MAGVNNLWHKRLSLLIFSAVFIVSTCVRAQDENTTLTRLNQLFEEHASQIASPGFSVVVVNNGSVVLVRGYGLKTVGEPEPVTERTIMPIGSVTKSFTAMIILQLQEQGLLNIDDPVIKYLPWFRAADKTLSDKITLRMCLNMTSGLEERFSRLSQNQSRRADALEKGVHNISSYRIVREPGQSFSYVNEGWNILGLIIEQVLEKPWEQVLAERVLQPLEMQYSSADRKVLEKLPVVTGHYAGIEPIPADFIHIQSSLPAGSGLYSTALDMANYMMVLLDDGTFKGRRLLKPSSIKALWKPAVSMSILPYELGGSGKPGFYAMGWMGAEVDGRQYVMHGGEFRVSSSMLVMEPERKAGVFLLYNTGGLDPYTSQSSIYVAVNTLRILADLPLSNFAVPRQQDPTLNNYQPKDRDFSLFYGTYLANSGKRLDLLKGGSEGLKISLIESIYPAEFDVDFVNETNFVARNIAGSRAGYFQRGREDSVQAINFDGETFNRKREAHQELLHYSNADLAISFMLPSRWQLKWNNTGFSAIDSVDPAFRFEGKASDMSYEEWLQDTKQAANSGEIVEMTEFQNGYFYQISSHTDNEGNRVLDLYTSTRGKNFLFSLKSPETSITNEVIRTLNPFLASLSLH